MPQYDFDLFTLGGGSGGVAASRHAAGKGARVALCEERQLGGTCVHRGCVPKKLLVTASQFPEHFEDAAGFGWSVPEPRLDWARLQAAKDRELARLEGTYRQRLEKVGVHLLEGRGRVVDAHTVEVRGERYTARHVLVATGAHPSVPEELPGREHVLTSDEVLRLSELPRRMVIVGGGYIGVEFAGLFNALGTRVTLLVRDAGVLPGFDEDVSAALAQGMRQRGVDLRTHTQVQRVERGREGTRRVGLREGGGLEADVVLYATGRVPHTRGLGLEAAGVRLDEEGAVVVDDASRSSVESLYAVGDVTARVSLTPVAIAEGRAVADLLFGGTSRRVSHEGVASAVFSHPPVASAGWTEREARERFGALDVYVSSFRPLPHALSGRDERAMVKVLVERSTGRVRGFHMVGPDAPEIIQGLAVALTCGVTKQQLDTTLGIHPTLAEEFMTLREPRPEPA